MSLSPYEIMLGHNLWASRIVLEAAAELDDAAFRRRFEIGPGSLHDTLRHIIGAMFRWSDRIADRDVRPSIEADDRSFTVAELARLLEQAHEELSAVVGETTARGGESTPVRFTLPDGQQLRFSRATAIVHVLTHGVHHRAQCLNMLRRLGRPLRADLALDPIEWECVQTGQFQA